MNPVEKNLKLLLDDVSQLKMDIRKKDEYNERSRHSMYLQNLRLAKSMDKMYKQILMLKEKIKSYEEAYDKR